MLLDDIRSALEALGPVRLAAPAVKVRGVHVDALFGTDRIRDAAQVLRARGFLIEDVTAVDAAPELMVVYHFAHPSGTCRTVLRALTDRQSPASPTIQDIFPGANWHERETHDFFGVEFPDHPDLSPLILPEDAGDLKPLRKDDAALKSLGEVIPEFGPPPSAEGEAGDRPVRKPRPKKEAAPKPEGES